MKNSWNISQSHTSTNTTFYYHRTSQEQSIDILFPKNGPQIFTIDFACDLSLILKNIKNGNKITFFPHETACRFSLNISSEQDQIFLWKILDALSHVKPIPQNIKNQVASDLGITTPFKSLYSLCIDTICSDPQLYIEVITEATYSIRQELATKYVEQSVSKRDL